MEYLFNTSHVARATVHNIYKIYELLFNPTQAN